jgi:hypothetical protein
VNGGKLGVVVGLLREMLQAQDRRPDEVEQPPV